MWLASPPSVPTPSMNEQLEDDDHGVGMRMCVQGTEASPRALINPYDRVSNGRWQNYSTQPGWSLPLPGSSLIKFWKFNWIPLRKGSERERGRKPSLKLNPVRRKWTKLGPRHHYGISLMVSQECILSITEWSEQRVCMCALGCWGKVCEENS